MSLMFCVSPKRMEQDHSKMYWGPHVRLAGGGYPMEEIWRLVGVPILTSPPQSSTHRPWVYAFGTLLVKSEHQWQDPLMIH